MPSNLPGLYAVTPDAPSAPELLDRVGRSLSAGVRLLQYRAKPAGDGGLRARAEAARMLAAACRDRQRRASAAAHQHLEEPA